MVICGILVSVSAALSGCGPRTEEKSIPSPLQVCSATVEAVRKALPANWGLEVDGPVLCVRRSSPVEGRMAQPNMNFSENPTGQTVVPAFTLTAAPFVSHEEREAIKARNAELNAESWRCFEDIKVAGIPYKPGMVPVHQFEFFPRTPAEAGMVRKFKAFHARIERLPDLYANGQSYFLNLNGFVFVRGQDRSEYRAVVDKVLSVFASYEPRPEPEPPDAGHWGRLTLPETSPTPQP